MQTKMAQYLKRGDIVIAEDGERLRVLSVTKGIRPGHVTINHTGRPQSFSDVPAHSMVAVEQI